MPRHRLRLLIVFFLLRLLAFSQSPLGLLTGTITDVSGAVVPGVKVTITNSASNETLSAETDAIGAFHFVNVPLGDYRLRATARGFTSFQTSVRILPGEASSVNIRLAVGVMTEAVEVSDDGGPHVNQSSDLIWNVWTEAFAPTITFNYLPTLKPNSDYNLVLDLSALPYGQEAGLYSQDVGKALKQSLHNLTIASLDVLIVPDQVAFSPQPASERLKTLSIDLKKLTKAQKQVFKIKGDALDLLKHDPNPKWVFGRISTRLRTTSRLGSASIALMFWSNGKPVDELALSVCISDGTSPCAPSGQVASLKGIDSIRIAASASKSQLPDAAIHLIALDSDQLVGVFKCNTCISPADRDYHTWQMSGTSSQLSAYLLGTNLADFEASDSDADYLQHGQELYLKLFRDGSTGQLAPAEAIFRQFLLTHAAQVTGKDSPSLFVRILPESPQLLFLVPLGLMAIPNTSYYVGDHFRVETPFQSQSYNASPACVSQWTLLVPPLDSNTNDSTDPMVEARGAFQTWIDKFAAWQGHATVSSDLTAFTTWLRGSKAQPEQSAVLIMSHHDTDKIYFEEGKQDIESVNVMRQFAKPSLVILAGCGTAQPGASDFLRSFNIDGVPTAIATSYAVEPKMAGLFTSKLMDYLQANANDPQYNLDEAKFDAAQYVRNTINPDNSLPYGPRALVFALVGDGSVRACVPPLSTP